MAIISISFDTKDKKLAVSIDGTPVEDVNSVYIDKYDTTPHIEIGMSTKIDKEGIRVVTRILASDITKCKNENVDSTTEIIAIDDVAVENKTKALERGAYQLLKREYTIALP